MDNKLDYKQEIKKDLKSFAISLVILIFSIYFSNFFDFKTYRGLGIFYALFQLSLIFLIPKLYMNISYKIITLSEKKLFLTNLLVLIIPILLSFLLIDYSYDFEYLSDINKSFFLAIHNINLGLILFSTIIIWISVPKQPTLKIKFDINKFIQYMRADQFIKSRNDIISYSNGLIIITFIMAYMTKILPERVYVFQSNYIIKYNDFGYEFISKVDYNLTLSISFLLHFYILYSIFWLVLLVNKPHFVFSTISRKL